MTNTKEFTVCGIKAINALFKKNPERIKRLFFNEDTAKICGGISKYLASNKKIYRMVPDEELQKVADSIHHGGVVAVINPPALKTIDANTISILSKNKKPLLVLENISNTHNLGAIVRSAAFFGFNEIVIANAKGQAKPSSAAYRVAEGGFEFVNIYLVDSIPDFLRDISNSFYIVGTSLRAKTILSKNLKIDAKGKNIALVLGNEEYGMTDFAESYSHTLLKIQGTGDMESINVTAAASVFMSYLV